jgi:hypothetical protein
MTADWDQNDGTIAPAIHSNTSNVFTIYQRSNGISRKQIGGTIAGAVVASPAVVAAAWLWWLRRRGRHKAIESSIEEHLPGTMAELEATSKDRGPPAESELSFEGEIMELDHKHKLSEADILMYSQSCLETGLDMRLPRTKDEKLWMRPNQAAIGFMQFTQLAREQSTRLVVQQARSHLEWDLLR